MLLSISPRSSHGWGNQAKVIVVGKGYKTANKTLENFKFEHDI